MQAKRSWVVVAVGLVVLVGRFPASAQAEQAFALTAGNSLLSFDTNTPGNAVPTSIFGLGASEALRGIDFRPSTGQLYAGAVTTATNSVITTYTINPASGAATLVGATGPVALAGNVPTGYDFNPVADRIRYVNTNDENARLFPAAPVPGGLAGDDLNLNPAGGTTVIGSAYDRNTPGTAATTLYAIDRNGSMFAIQGGIDGAPTPNLGEVTDLASLGFFLAGGSDAGFDISRSGVAYAALTALDGVTRLYTINLSGAANVASPVGTIGNGATPVFSLAIEPPPPSEGPVAGDTTPPDTRITERPKDKTKKKRATFEFTGTDGRAIASFQCKLDSGAFAPCTSPHTVKVKKGKHTFEVQAIDQAGNVGPPATDTWKRKKKKK